MKLLITFSILLFLISCAQISTLTGGEKDTTAPKIIPSKSSPQQGQLNYTNPEMTLVFDEFIVLKSPSSTVSFTPQPIVAPTITSKNKKLTIVFNDPLLPNTTYSIAFNGTITDLNEGNDSLFQYVFSTGSYIDSMQFMGSVTDAYTNKAAENILIGLYTISDTITSDSLPYKIKPTYIGQTNKQGLFHLNYIKSEMYIPYAFKDIDKNLLFNPNNEQIGFLSEPICCLDSISDSNNFKLFVPTKIEQGVKSISMTYPGQVSIVFKEKQPAHFDLNYSIPLIEKPTKRSDSIVYWLSEPFQNQSEFILTQNNKTDTLRAIMTNLPKKGDANPLTNKNNYHENKLLPNDTLSYFFNQPIKINDPSLINIVDEDSNTIAHQTKIKDLTVLQVIPESDKAKYISIDSAAIHSILTLDVNNRINTTFARHSDKYYGQLLFELKADSTKTYILELLEMSGEMVSKQIVEGSSSTSFSELLPGNYQLRLIDDTDLNGEWTTGNLSKQEQPESVFYYTSPIKIRSNWDLDLEWILEN
ncbi:MAG: Ig-like domain-containing protein [Crocinitomicaceae bacterium]